MILAPRRLLAVLTLALPPVLAAAGPKAPLPIGAPAPDNE
jgi:hypothetical protein